MIRIVRIQTDNESLDVNIKIKKNELTGLKKRLREAYKTDIYITYTNLTK